eukprot:2043458-Amphidinium_carterae.6
MDYAFLKHQGEPGQRNRLVNVLTMVETVTGMSDAVIVEHKGVTQYALGAVKKFILENGILNSVIQVYGEPAIKSEVTTDHPIFPWMVKHVGFTHNIFQLGQDGQAPYSRTWDQKYKSAIIAFGKTVLCQHNHHDKQKIDDTLNGKHLTLTSEGLIKSRSVRRLTLSHRVKVAILRRVVGTPSDPSGRRHSCCTASSSIIIKSHKLRPTHGSRSARGAVKHHHIHSIKANWHAHSISFISHQATSWIGGSANLVQTHDQDNIHWSRASPEEIKDRRAGILKSSDTTLTDLQHRQDTMPWS